MIVATNPAYVDELVHQLLQLANTDRVAYGNVLEMIGAVVDVPQCKLTSTLSNALVGRLTSAEMLEELKRRGGHPGALAEAALLCIRKSQDYNQAATDMDPHKIDRSSYFPFGDVSYAQMLHTKSQRFNSLVLKSINGQDANFEGLRDTALDIINYAGFFAGQHKE